VIAPALRIAAQAKINLHLRVFARDDSGYHSLETIFHRIDLSDDILIEITPRERTLDVSGGQTGPTESNLAWRAAHEYAERNGWPRGFRIELTKRIPVGAGLGGGSADAAAVLRSLNSLSPNPMGQVGLLSLAAKLGSDIPFLASDAVMALAWGRGERMLSLPPLPRKDLLVMSPQFSVSTADAYGWLDEDRASRKRARAVMEEDEDEVSESTVLDTLSLSTWDSIARFARNDFEGPVGQRHPRLREYLERLRNSRAIFSGMTGSGSTIFGVLDSPPTYAKVPEEHRASVTTTKTAIDVVQPVRVG
jgi:4-diphosphocytidyl-2-C-methyl-D-erythritol kinase